MRVLWTVLAAVLLAATPAFAGVDEMINEAFAPVASSVSSVVFFKVHVFGADLPLVVAWLVAAAVFFSFYLGFINIRGFSHAIKITRGDFAKPDSHGEVSHFQALCTAVSGTVGIGNIAGIPIAMSMGGVGAIFWMFVAGILGMSSKFAECTLATKYRRENPDGTVSGGPMYYIQYGFKERGLPGMGKFVGTLYALGIVVGCIGIGNMFQSNQAYLQVVTMVEHVTGSGGWVAENSWFFGLAFAAIVFAVTVGGIRSIARVADKVVPFMAVFYVLAAIIVILLNAQYIVPAISMILKHAFNPEAIGGGVVGVLVIGFTRAVFSNECGLGSAAIAHSAVKTDEPVTEGFVALLEPFIDTIVVQMITALVITTTMLAVPGFADSGLNGMAMSSAAFATKFSWAPVAIAFAGMLFAFTTGISWSYYGLKGWTYLFGESAYTKRIFQIIFCLFFALGPVVKLGNLMDLSDALVMIICVPNIIGLYMLAPHVKEELTDYWERLHAGEVVNYKQLEKEAVL